jgi:hypothetical protein
MSGDCGKREERLVSLLYEDGEPAELADIRAHLETCETCREEFEKLTSTRELLAAWPDVVNAPRVVYVNEPARVEHGVRGGGRWFGRSVLESFLPSLAAAAVVVVLFAVSASFLRFQVGPDGELHVGMAASSTPAAAPTALVTRGDLDQGLAQTAAYLESMMRTAREQDRQALLGVVDQALRDQNASMGVQVSSAIDSAFDEIDRRRRSDLSVMLSSMNDLQVVTGTELQRMNAMLASLAPTPGAEQE